VRPEQFVPMKLFASKLRERAEELGIAHAEAARRADLGERRYGNYVTGIREPKLATLVQIALALQTTPNRLLGFDDQKMFSSRSLLENRLISATYGVADEVVERLIVQVEALRDYELKKSNGAD